jgi:hypothetical protein
MDDRVRRRSDHAGRTRRRAARPGQRPAGLAAKCTEQVPAIEPENDIVSSFIEPVSPEINGAVTPGL